ncbi:CheY-like chemotaxis protein [Luteimonas sp. J16]|uniref:response regulator n=1 Tax=unclassified Luteimonas TaxID=2629088 RepID=UPI00047AB8D6|nr:MULTISPECIES: response regulator [unclassified Luteimonas]TWG92214.1 CheY-like chemotaxis protein [Luteimonas sp. J16]
MNAVVAAATPLAFSAPGLRVLLVEDSPDDAELAEWALRKAGIDVRCVRACTAIEVAAALAGFAPQVVVSDLNLPGFSGAQALTQVRAHDPSLPFVFLTGGLAPGDSVPVADGLLSKDALDELPPLLLRLVAQRG